MVIAEEKKSTVEETALLKIKQEYDFKLLQLRVKFLEDKCSLPRNNSKMSKIISTELQTCYDRDREILLTELKMQEYIIQAQSQAKQAKEEMTMLLLAARRIGYREMQIEQIAGRKDRDGSMLTTDLRLIQFFKRCIEDIYEEHPQLQEYFKGLDDYSFNRQSVFKDGKWEPPLEKVEHPSDKTSRGGKKVSD